MQRLPSSALWRTWTPRDWTTPRGIVLDATAGKMYWTDAGTDRIQRGNLDGTAVENLVTSGLDWLRCIAFDDTAVKMYWTDEGAGMIQRGNLDGTAWRTAYAESKYQAGIEWEIHENDDNFSVADNSHNCWNGYFVTRPDLTAHVKRAPNLMNAAWQMEVLTGINAAQVDHPTVRNGPPVGDSFTDSLEGTIGAPRTTTA